MINKSALYVIGNTPVNTGYKNCDDGVELIGYDFTVIDPSSVNWLAKSAMRPVLIEEITEYHIEGEYRSVSSLTVDSLCRTVDLRLTEYPTANTVRIYSSQPLDKLNAVLLGRLDVESSSDYDVKSTFGNLKDSFKGDNKENKWKVSIRTVGSTDYLFFGEYVDDVDRKFFAIRTEGTNQFLLSKEHAIMFRNSLNTYLDKFEREETN